MTYLISSARRRLSRSQKIAWLAVGALVCVLAVAGIAASIASAEFQIQKWDANVPLTQSGEPFTQAGGHPDEIVTTVEASSHQSPNPESPPGWTVADESIKDILADTPPGLIGNPTVLPTCTDSQLAGPVNSIGSVECPAETQVGWLQINDGSLPLTLKLYNMEPGTGLAARFAFNFLGTIVTLQSTVREGPGLHLTVDSRNISQAITFIGAKVVFWGTPAAPIHDAQRCSGISGGFQGLFAGPGELCPGAPGEDNAPTPVNLPRIPFLTLPTSCPPEGVGSRYDVAVDSWDNPGIFKTATLFTHLPEPEQETQLGTENCSVVPSNPKIALQPTGQSAQSPTGVDVSLSVPTDGLLNPDGIAQSHLKQVVVKLPEGMSINPSQGEGLGVCTKADLARETASSEPGEGCPSTSKLGTVSVHTPLLEEALEGSVYLAKPDDLTTPQPGAENPFDSLVALYIVVKNYQRGVVIKLAGKVEGDPVTGQLTTTFDDLPQVPFSDFNLHFRSGARSPLTTPAACGTYTAQADFTPWSAPDTVIHRSASFEISSGIGGGPCPSGNTPPFTPKLDAGTLNNNAGSFSPFYIRMFRTDEQQEITNFSADLPPGMAAKLAGIPKCSDAALREAALKTGTEELNHPSCPAASQVGHALVGYGVGTSLTYAPGKVYLAGPYHGTPVSIATVTSALLGPYDVGTVIVRSAFRVDPETAQVHVDSKGSDPIPHILRGIPLHLRDIRVYMDRPNFTINPTSCDPTSVGALMTGSGARLGDPGDDFALPISNPFQASNCSLLGFKPKLSFRLKGGTHRGDLPALTATLRGRPGDANLGKAVVTLPKSEILEQGHIRTVCTRVEFAGDACPAGSVYGHVKATTPLLDHPLEGNVYLRSNGGERLLPDLVAALRGEINVNAVGFIDSNKGGIRTTFNTIPDTPVTQFTLQMQGGKKGLFINSRNLCLKPSRADVLFTGQNGKIAHLRPKVQNSCKNVGRKTHKRHR